MASDYSWNQHARIVDIGGAYGSFIGHLLTVHKRPRGVLFDQSQACLLPLLRPQASFSRLQVLLGALEVRGRAGTHHRRPSAQCKS